MGRYGDKNLIRYGEAIQLHFDPTGTIGWLTLKNYGFVFHRFPWAQPLIGVKHIVVGIPAGTLDLREAQKFAELAEIDVAQVMALQPPARTISISAMLDVIEIIKFQTQILKEAGLYSQGGKDWDKDGELQPAFASQFPTRRAFPLKMLSAMIEHVLMALGCQPPNARHWYPFPGEDIWEFMVQRLFQMLHKPPGARWILPQITENRGSFTAYLPAPWLILEEQRTKLRHPTDVPGKTVNSDSRSIKPVCASSPNSNSDQPAASETHAEEILRLLDEEREQNEQEFLKRGKRDLILGKSNFAKSADYLHRHVPRIDCYGFRGDKRSLTQIKEGYGFYPGVTRRDIQNVDFLARTKKIDEARFISAETYKKALMDLDIVTLAVYTADPEGKAYISTSTSTAIAKHFANAYAEAGKPFASVYCYAIRCVNGFYLPTELKGPWRTWSRQRNAENALVHHAEQEVAVLGGMGTDKVAGMRVIRVDASGQYFSGPVFMRDDLRKEYVDKLPKEAYKIILEPELELDDDKKAIPLLGKDGKQLIDRETGLPLFKPVIDRATGKPKYKLPKGPAHKYMPTPPEPDDNAFDELFELFSGKSQGGSPEIFFSYKEAPFDCPESYIFMRDAKAQNEERQRILPR